MVTLTEQLAQPYQGPLIISFYGAIRGTKGVVSSNAQNLFEYILFAYQSLAGKNLTPAEKVVFKESIERVEQDEAGALVFFVYLSERSALQQTLSSQPSYRITPN